MGDAATRGRGRRTAALVALAALAFVGALVAAWVLAGQDAPQGYDGAARAEFVAACRSAAPGLPGGVCDCAFDGLAAEVPFDDLDELVAQLPGIGGTDTSGDASLGTGGTTPADEDVTGRTSPELVRIIDGCVAEARSAATTGDTDPAGAGTTAGTARG